MDEGHEQRLSYLEKLKAELDQRASLLDDRDNTHVRREIRDNMLNDVKSRIENFGVSEATGKKRTPVFIGMVALIATFGLLLGYTFWGRGPYTKKQCFSLRQFVMCLRSG